MGFISYMETLFFVMCVCNCILLLRDPKMISCWFQHHGAVVHRWKERERSERRLGTTPSCTWFVNIFCCSNIGIRVCLLLYLYYYYCHCNCICTCFLFVIALTHSLMNCLESLCQCQICFVLINVVKQVSFLYHTIW